MALKHIMISCVWGVMALKRYCLFESEALDPQNLMFNSVWDHWHFKHIMCYRVGRLGPLRKRLSDMFAPGSGGFGSQDVVARRWKPGSGSQDVETRMWKPGSSSPDVAAMMWWPPGSGSQVVEARIW